VSIVVIIAKPAKRTDSIPLVPTRRRGVIATKLEPKAVKCRSSRIMAAAAKAVPHGAAPMRRSL
jgi:hypothetical protein